MKAKFEVGAQIDFLTREELSDELKVAMGAWRAEIGRGVKWRKFSAATTLTGATWVMGGGAQANNNKDTLGPGNGFVWAVTRIAVAGNGFVPGTDLFSVFIDEASAVRLVSSGHTRWQPYDVGVLVLNGGEELVLSGAGTGTGTDVILSGQAVELPAQLAWQLL